MTLRSAVGARDSVARWGFYGYAAVGSLLAVVFLAVEPKTVATALEAAIVLALSLTLVYSGWDAEQTDVSPEGTVRALAWTGVIGVTFSLLAVAVALVWSLEGHPVVDTTFMVVFALALGLAVGAPASVYAVASGEKRRRLADLVKLLTLNQRVLRHNLRNELSIVDGHLENLGDRVGEDDADVAVARRHVDELLATSERTRRILDLWDSDDCREQAVGDVLASAVERVRERLPDADVEVDASTDATVSAHSALEDAFYEALANAVEHNDPDVRVTATVATDGGDAVVDVSDTGRGITASERAIFDQPGETKLSHASGLGLWLVYWIVRESGGSVSFSENEPTGTTVRLRLPRADRDAGLRERVADALR
jgi:signal transduction histidine kinase